MHQSIFMNIVESIFLILMAWALFENIRYSFRKIKFEHDYLYCIRWHWFKYYKKHNEKEIEIINKLNLSYIEYLRNLNYIKDFYKNCALNLVVFNSAMLILFT